MYGRVCVCVVEIRTHFCQMPPSCLLTRVLQPIHSNPILTPSAHRKRQRFSFDIELLSFSLSLSIQRPKAKQRAKTHKLATVMYTGQLLALPPPSVARFR